MRKIIFALIVIPFIGLLSAVKTYQDETSREWVNYDGNNLLGKLLAVNTNTARVQIKSTYPTNRVFWYNISKLSSRDQNYVSSRSNDSSPLKINKNLYNDEFYDTISNKDWEFYDLRYCDVTLDVDYSRLSRVPSHFKYDDKTGNLKSCILYLWNNPKYNKNISQMIHDFKFKPTEEKLQTRGKNFTDGILTNIQVLHYLGIQADDFMKLRWFFSAEDFAFFPEKIYKFLGVLDKVSTNFSETELFHKRHARGVPIILYWKDRGELRSRWSNFYLSFNGKIKMDQPYTKIIYLKCQ